MLGLGYFLRMTRGALYQLERLSSFRRLDVEHADHRADGDVMAEQPDGFDEFCAAEFALHASEQFLRQGMIMHQGACEFDQQPLFAGELVDRRLGTQGFDDVRIDRDACGRALRGATRRNARRLRARQSG